GGEPPRPRRRSRPHVSGGRAPRRRYHHAADARLRRAVLREARPPWLPAGAARPSGLTVTRWLDPAVIAHLAADPAQRMRAPERAAIDFTGPFVPEDYTQLYYTPLYRGLHREHRLRYNQLFGIRINEYIMMLEADLVERLLAPLRRHPSVATDAALVQ